MPPKGKANGKKSPTNPAPPPTPPVPAPTKDLKIIANNDSVDSVSGTNELTRSRFFKYISEVCLCNDA